MKSFATNLFRDGFVKVATQITDVYSRIDPELAYYRHRSEVPGGLPEIIAECFAASMQREEGRPTRIRVICASPEIIDTLEISGHWDYCNLVKKLPLTAHALRKLSAGLEEPKAGVIVWSEGSTPMIQGVVRIARKWGNDRPHHEWGHMVRYALSITVKGPGLLIFDDLEQLVGEFENGTFWESAQVFAKGSPFSICLQAMASKAFEEAEHLLWSTVMGRDEEAAIMENPTDQDRRRMARHKIRWSEAVDEWDEVYKFVVSSVLRHMQNHGRGGTLIITADDPVAQLEENGNGYEFEDESRFHENVKGAATLQIRIADYFKSLIESDTQRISAEEIDKSRRMKEAPAEVNAPDEASQIKGLVFTTVHKIHSMHAAFSELMRSVRFVANVTGADGATIMLPSLGVFSMGAKLGAEPIGKDSVKIYKSGTNSPSDLSDGEAVVRYLETLDSYTEQRGKRF